MIKILELFETYKQEINQYKIIIVANVRNHTGNFKSITLNKANPIEFFSDDEFDQICNGISSLGIFTKIYYNELDFIEDVLNQKYVVNKIIVINFARNGIIEGKKSLVPAFCDLLNIKYTTSNAFVQSLCRDKFVWSCVLRQAGLPSLKTLYIQGNYVADIDTIYNNELYILKPKSESSSLHVGGAVNKQKVLSFVQNNKEDYIVQKYLCGIEIEVPFFELNGDYFIQEPVQINYSGNILCENLSEENDYYYSDCQLTKTEMLNIKEIALKTAKILNIKKYGRIDFKLDRDSSAYIIDIATLPYLTKNSSFAFAASRQNLHYNSIFKALLTIAFLSVQS